VTTAEHAPRWVDLSGAHNVRDLGGLPAASGTVRPRVLLRGDNLDNLTADDIALLGDEIGLRGVIDLRAPFENPRPADWFSPRGVTWLHEPLLDLTGLTDPAVLRERTGYDYGKLYARMLESAGAGLARILAFLVSGPTTPALVHCAAGKDRTGVTVSVLLSAAGVDRDAIIADYLATGERLAAIRAALARREEYRHLRDQATAGGQAPVAPPIVDPAAIEGVLDVVESAPDGAAGYLVASGATPEQISRWREMIIEPN
jgi:protein-tyrosine phosphatase